MMADVVWSVLGRLDTIQRGGDSTVSADAYLGSYCQGSGCMAAADSPCSGIARDYPALRPTPSQSQKGAGGAAGLPATVAALSGSPRRMVSTTFRACSPRDAQSARRQIFTKDGLRLATP